MKTQMRQVSAIIKKRKVEFAVAVTECTECPLVRPVKNFRWTCFFRHKYGNSVSYYYLARSTPVSNCLAATVKEGKS